MNISISHHVLSGARFVIRRSAVFFVAVILVSMAFVDYERLYLGERVRTQYYFKPQAYDRMLAFIDGYGYKRSGWLKEYAYYYEQVLQFVGDRPDAQLLLGYCYSYLGKQEAAKEMFTRSRRGAPDIFWPDYNLAVLAFKTGDYAAARQHAKEAIAKNPNVTIQFMLASPNIYQPLIERAGANVKALSQRVRRAYLDAYKILVLSSQSLGDEETMTRAAGFAIQANVGEERFFEQFRVPSSVFVPEQDKHVALRVF